MCENPCDSLARTLSNETPDLSGIQIPAVPKTTGDTAAKTSGTAGAEAVFPQRNARLIRDESTHILQVVVRDADTEKVLAKFPDDRWLEAVEKIEIPGNPV